MQIHPLNTKCQKWGEKKKTIQISSASVYKSVATTVDSTVQQWKAIVQKIWKAGTRMRRESSYHEFFWDTIALYAISVIMGLVMMDMTTEFIHNR